MMPQKETIFLSSFAILMFSLAGGLAVANVYYAQPLLKLISAELGIHPGSEGLIVTITQIGYGLGLFFIVPLGDLLNRRKLIVGQLLLSSLILLLVSLSHQQILLLGAMAFLGLMAVVTQLLVSYAATLALPAERGRIVGLVTSGVVVGILLARTVAGVMADLAGWRAVYMLSAMLTVVLAGIMFKILPVKDTNKAGHTYLQLLRSMFTLFRREPLLFIRSLIALFLFAAFSTLWTALVLPLSAVPMSLSPSEIGLFGLVGIAGTVGAAKAGRLADRGLGQYTTDFALTLLLLSWIAIGFKHILYGH